MLVHSAPDTVRYGALEIAFKKFAGDLGPYSLGEIRNRGGRPAQGCDFLRRAAGEEKNWHTWLVREKIGAMPARSAAARLDRLIARYSADAITRDPLGSRSKIHSFRGLTTGCYDVKKMCRRRRRRRFLWPNFLGQIKKLRAGDGAIP